MAVRYFDRKVEHWNGTVENSDSTIDIVMEQGPL